MNKKVRILILSIFISICLFAGLFFAMFFFSGDKVQTQFTSPSGKNTIIVEEFCMGFACDQEAYRKKGIIKEKICRLDVGDPERIVFRNAKTQWNNAENEMTWQVSTRQGVKMGIISLEDNTCKKIMSELDN